MKSLIIYDSMFGNTEKIAKAIGDGLTGDVRVLRISETKLSDLDSLNVLIIGSPTQGGRTTKTVQDFLNTIPGDALKNVSIGAFDTRFAAKDHNFALRILMKTIGYAAEKIAASLESKGGHLAAPPEPFFVTGKEGPIKDGELERATAWAKTIASGIQ